ncbi:UNVERIFIED_CONTAM: Homeobox-leucine zipper protein HDG11 [Sesamum latifolium]|uniref:Homeobox-leucine zipper protein HDG11 n=1 Tax=Sesamum latifolium TaxID=2727402 RepID=A0AAW2UMB4_9LAMI
MEFSSGGGGGSSGGDHQDASDPHRRKKRYHRHTANQIQRLEAMFKECPHPDEKTRNLLSRELALHPRQIKFWFQNRRTQMKSKWVELFPTIVARARTVEVISSGMLGSQSGTLQLVTWVEHWEVEDKAPIHRLYRDLIHSGLAFGAERWLSTLQRMSERFACLIVTANSTRDLGGVIPSVEGKRSMMKLAQRMVNNFCSSINPAGGQQWTTLSGLNEFEVRATVHRSIDPGQPNGVVLSAAATIWLPVPPQNVFNFFKDERTRPQWDVLSNQNPVQEVLTLQMVLIQGTAYLSSGQNNMLILQESCIDSSGSLVVYCPVDLPAINIAMSGEDPSYIPLLPSGFTITPDGRADHLQAGGADGASTSSNLDRSSGSLITVMFQILVSNLPTARMSPESITTVNNLISNTIHQIKSALNCTTS